MGSADAAARIWIGETLADDALLALSLEQRWFADVAPEVDPATLLPVIYPLGLIQKVSSVPQYALGLNPVKTPATFLVRLIDETGGYEALETLFNRVYKVLHGAPSAVVTISDEDYTIEECRLMSTVEGSGAEDGIRYTWRGGNFRVIVS